MTSQNPNKSKQNGPAVILGLDIGSNSVGSAWINLKEKIIDVGVSVFPAGVDEQDEKKRGAPKNQDRRLKRSQRRNIARRSKRKRYLRQLLVENQLLPGDKKELQSLFDATDPWELRAKGLDEQLHAFEFGRIVLHLSQRRGAFGLILPAEDEENSEDSGEEGKVKAAVDKTKIEMLRLGARTFGELVFKLRLDEKRNELNESQAAKKKGQPTYYFDAVRNKNADFKFHADRTLIRNEWLALVKKQQNLPTELAKNLTSGLIKTLDDPNPDPASIWRNQGRLFEQRRTYWDVGTLGRCDLEPTDRCVPHADRHASRFRVLESVNNIRIRGPKDSDYRPLTSTENQDVIEKLQSQKTASVSTIRSALKIDKRSLASKNQSERDWKLNIEQDESRSLNTDWFHREIVANGLGEEKWDSLSESDREGLNRLILKLDRKIESDEIKFREKLGWLNLDEATVDRLTAGWLTRPDLDKRLKFSRRALLNFMPWMEQFDDALNRWPTQIEAKLAFAKTIPIRDKNGKQDKANAARKKRYEGSASSLTTEEQHYLEKHGTVLPPAPNMSNPVVRKAIHEVRRHVMAYCKKHDRTPDQIVIEFARETTKPAKVNDEILRRNRQRELIRKTIRTEIVEQVWGAKFPFLSRNQLRTAEDRVLLCMQQRGVCAYSLDAISQSTAGNCAYSAHPITLRQAALGEGVEIDHIIPYSRCGDNSLNNRVLCISRANQNKGNDTPREWWGDENFDERIASLRFMEGYKPDREDFFRARDYSVKWRNLTRKKDEKEWKPSQLSDTAYAAKEVQSYLQRALWPDEILPQDLNDNADESDVQRRIFVTKGRYTSILRKDWQLYHRAMPHGATQQEFEHAIAKNRGDHREHAVDAVVIAFTSGSLLHKLAKLAREAEEQRNSANSDVKIKREPLKTPWGSIESFKHQVMSQIYSEYDGVNGKPIQSDSKQPIVVSHRPIGRKVTGKFHEETLFSPILELENGYVGRISIEKLKTDHLRPPVAEKESDAIKRLATEFMNAGDFKKMADAKKKAKSVVESKTYEARLVNPPAGKSGLIRDVELRQVLRSQLEARFNELNLKCNAENFNDADIKKALKEGPLTMPSGVPIKRIRLIRVHKDPVRIERQKYDYQNKIWKRDVGKLILPDLPSNDTQSDSSSSITKADRIYVGGNNHHLEIREDENGNWKGDVVPTFVAANRIHKLDLEAVDKSDDPDRGGRFIMSLSEGETVRMHNKDGKTFDYHVVFKIDKPQSVYFKPHWDARRAKGEKDSEGNLISGSVREGFPVSPNQLKLLGETPDVPPIKVLVGPLGQISHLEPVERNPIPLNQIDCRVVEVVRQSIEHRKHRTITKSGKKPNADGKKCLSGSWTWMKKELVKYEIENVSRQISEAFRHLNSK